MIVFKTFLKVLNKNKIPIIIYTAVLIFFGGFNIKSGDNVSDFTATKPDVLLINSDEEVGITKNFIDYFEKNANLKDINKDEESINDALFYRDVNYVIYIPQGFRADFLDGKNPQIDVKSTSDYQASIAKMLLERYIKVARDGIKDNKNEEDLIAYINDTLNKNVEVELKSSLDTDTMLKITRYFNFASYSILAIIIYVIGLILTSFKDENIKKRTTISSMNYKKFNRNLFISNCVFGFVLWLLLIILSVILIGNSVFTTTNGLLFIGNSFIFTICALSMAFFIGNLVTNKNAISGIVNVVALGSSFLCGAFVPMEFLPDSVLKIAHILPTYWFIKSNETIGNTEVFGGTVVNSLVTNMIVLIAFTIVFAALTNVVSKKNRKIA